MPPSPAALSLFILTFVLLLVGICFAAVADSLATEVSKDMETTLRASRSWHILSQMSASQYCTADKMNDCDFSCVPIDLASSVPTFAYFTFYNITNVAAVNSGSPPALQEVGPFSCVTAPPHSEARLVRTLSTPIPDTTSAASMSFQHTLQCDQVVGGGGGDALVTLYDKTLGVTTRTASQWVATLKAQVLADGDSVGTGGAPSFGEYSEHGNTSMPNNYMRRLSDDAPLLPFFPHAYVPDDDYKLMPAINEQTTLQWHVASVDYTLSFSWKHSLYLKEIEFDRVLYARFVAYLPTSGIDLSARGSTLFDLAYSYHKCAADGSSLSLDFDSVTDYPPCAAPPLDDTLSPDDFFVDVDLMLGIPTRVKDTEGAGGWEAWQYPAFSALSFQNCTAKYGDANVAGNLWAWGFWSGSVPYVSHSGPDYNPYDGGDKGKWLAEFGVRRNGKIMPAFAFSMMPKLIPLVSPTAVGATYPYTIMGKRYDALTEALESVKVVVTSQSSYMYIFGVGTQFSFIFGGHAEYFLYISIGIYSLISAVLTALYGVYRMKADSQS